MPTVTVSEKGQVVIPVAIRRSLGIKAGTTLGLELDNGVIYVKVQHALPPSQLDAGYGLLRPQRSAKPRHLDEFDVAQAMRRSK